MDQHYPITVPTDALDLYRTRLSHIHPATVPPTWLNGTNPDRLYLGMAHHMAYKYLIEHADLPGIRLVHGTVAPYQLAIPHAWIELPGGVVFDGEAQRFCERASYYTVQQAEGLDAYTPQDATSLRASTGHVGPMRLR